VGTAQDLLDYLHMQERAGKLQLDWKERMIRTQNNVPVGSIDEIVSLLATAGSKPNRQDETRALQLVQTVQLPMNLIKNAYIKKAVQTGRHMQTPVPIRGVETPVFYHTATSQDDSDDVDAVIPNHRKRKSHQSTPTRLIYK
jgi:hypothetical protein